MSDLVIGIRVQRRRGGGGGGGGEGGGGGRDDGCRLCGFRCGSVRGRSCNSPFAWPLCIVARLLFL